MINLARDFFILLPGVKFNLKSFQNRFDTKFKSDPKVRFDTEMKSDPKIGFEIKIKSDPQIRLHTKIKFGPAIKFCCQICISSLK